MVINNKSINPIGHADAQANSPCPHWPAQATHVLIPQLSLRGLCVDRERLLINTLNFKTHTNHTEKEVWEQEFCTIFRKQLWWISLTVIDKERSLFSSVRRDSIINSLSPESPETCSIILTIQENTGGGIGVCIKCIKRVQSCNDLSDFHLLFNVSRSLKCLVEMSTFLQWYGTRFPSALFKLLLQPLIKHSSVLVFVWMALQSLGYDFTPLQHLRYEYLWI